MKKIEGNYFVLTFIAVLLVLTISAYGQIDRNQILGAYVYNFAKLSSSPKQKTFDTYNIVLVSEDKEIIQEFMNMAKDVKVGSKEIIIDHNPEANNIDFDNTCMIFISDDKVELYPRIFAESKNFEVLLVSENFNEKRSILLNIYETDKGKMLFEMNKGNIYERKIEINDEVLLMGGTEIDIVELYLNTQHKLNSSEEKLLQSKKSLANLIQQVEAAEIEVVKQKDEVKKQKNERQKLNKEIEIYKIQLETQKKAYLESEDKQETFNDSLNKTIEKLQEFKSELVKGDEFLKKQKKEIASKEKILAEKNIIINRQRNIVILFIIGSTIISFLTILLLKSFRDKKRKNIVLQKQQEEISRKNKELDKNNTEIKHMNSMLNEKNEELTTTLEEIKQIQNQLVHSAKMASLGVLSAGIAHEINNPINFVYAGINSLLRDFKDIEPVINEVCSLDLEKDDLEEKIKKIQRLKQINYFDDAIAAIPEIINDIKLGADRTTEIVKGLRNFSRMDKGISESLNINEGLDTSLLLLKNKYKIHIEIIKDYDNELPNLICHPGKINQAFLNIISNAIDSIPKSGKVWLKTYKKENEIIISIRDNGVGISDDMKEKLFDPFFTSKPVGEGTGLGLSITYGIIKEHNGKIDINSEPQKGSEFIISLPISEK